jgi:predicted oxidoreductase (fatty acid repression mutant protein)
MKSWGRYELVAAPGDADLVFEIRLTVFQLQRERVLTDDSPAFDSQFRIVICDAKTHQRLWGLTEHAQGAVLLSNRDKNFEQALAAVVAEVQRIVGPAAAAPAKN